MKTKECDYCHGMGVVMDFINNIEGDHEIPCKVCKGEGIIWMEGREKNDKPTG